MTLSIRSAAVLACLTLSCPVHADTCTPVVANWSSPDAEGHMQVELRLEEVDQPWRGVTTPRRATYCLAQRLPIRARITRVRTFVATDRGDRAELALHVVVDGYQLVTRSIHKETEGIYDAWVEEQTQYITADAGYIPSMLVYAAGWATAKDANGALLPVNIEFGVIVELTLNGWGQ